MALQAAFSSRARNLGVCIWEPYMYLGSAYAAGNREWLRKAGITHIMNVADDVDNELEGDEEFHIEYCNLGVSDFGADKGISRVFPTAFEFMEKVLKNDGKLLIHCAAGANRSPTIVIAILMKFKQMTLVDAFKHVRSLRKITPLRDNREQLLLFERELYGKNSVEPDRFFSA